MMTLKKLWKMFTEREGSKEARTARKGSVGNIAALWTPARSVFGYGIILLERLQAAYADYARGPEGRGLMLPSVCRRGALLSGAGSTCRIALVFCILFYFPATAANMAEVIHGKLAAARQNGEGLGGMVYSETEVERLVSANSGNEDGLAEGVPEPEGLLPPRPLIYSSYTVQPGDMIGLLSLTFGLNQDTLISVNRILNTRSIQAGKTLLIPNQDGVMHTVGQNETLEGIARQYEASVSEIVTVNELFSERVNAGASIFIPNAKLDSTKLQEINGDLFIWPVRGRITSRYGYRINPVTNRRGFHAGLDISANTGVPIKAAMSGMVLSTGYNDIFGYFVIISHHSSYRTMYAHMSVISTKPGAYVGTGQVIGNVGNTGQSSGSHLHFQVYKSGLTVNPVLLMN
jgi:murein DD-endopeptidase MepM/ murein hydrolase activator NlpD